LTRLDATRQILDSIHARLAEASLRNVDIGPAGEWLLDNFHIVQEHVREVHQSLPRDYYRELPQLASGTLIGYPRVYEIAITLISHTEGRIDLENVDLFVDAFQEVVVLSIGELWAIPAMLRLGLIESIRRMALRTVERLDEVEAAEQWIERIQEAHGHDPDAVGQTLADFVGSPPALTPVFVSRFLAGLRLAGGAFPPLVWLEHWFADEGLSPDDAAVRATQRLALTKVMMSNSITSLRGLGQRDWRAFVERQSAMEHALRAGDPSRFYTGMTFATRDAYRHAVERIAKRTRHSETDVVRRAVDLAKLDPGLDPADSRREHVGYYLVDRGVADLEAELGYKPRAGEALHRWVLRHPSAVYVGALVAFTLGAVIAALRLAGAEAGAAWPLVVLLTLLPAADIAVSLVNQVVTAFLPPRVLPRLDLSDHGVPAAYRTAIVVPTLFPNVDAVHEALETLEVQFLANRDAHLHYAILSDFTDGATASEPGDAEILAAAAEGVRALNDRYAPDEGDTFYLFHRPRRWNAQQGVWMGWERKRGKLAQFNRFIRGEAPDAFSLVVGKADILRHIRYVITLDSDTLLPPEAAPSLIGALAHPLNRARYDEVRGRVVDGYGIIQPRVGVSVASAQRSRFAAIYSGHPGVDPYTTAVSDVYQDLFGEGSFTGKGIYDVDAFEQATHGRFPENTLLSHDLIEGNYARAGLATDISVFDEYPSSYLTFSRRKHRWVRGDWQLLQWLTPRVPGPDGQEPNRLSVLSRWKILDNLRRSTVEIAQLALLIAGWTILPGSPLRWTLLALGAIAAPWALSMLIAAVRPPGTRSWRAYYHALGEDAAVSLQQFALAVAFLPHQAWLSADGIVRTLWRTWVSKKRLLEWQAASLVERSASGTLARFWWSMGPALAMMAAIAALVVVSSGWSGGLAVAMLPLVAAWLASPVIAHRLASPAARTAGVLTESVRAKGLRYAETHWQYFDQFVSESSHWLAPDNFQEDPVPVVAMRTSPTNIGLQLLATVSARDLGFIDLEEMVERLERAFASIARLERHRGHFFNWYELNHLTVLEPAYVSTVDSGNLAGHFIALRQACLAMARDSEGSTPELQSRLGAIGDMAERYAMEMDFGFLFDTSRKLFTIGYHTGTHTPDDSHYDLLASEARLASFVAIAKNDVPVEHWFRLGRTLTHVAGDTALVSWSGSMFEYLMPTLVMHAFPATVLGRTARVALERQIEYGDERGVPWGASECAYNVRDRHLTYQYRAFGVPELGLKRGLGRDVVIAPYATALAALLERELATANLARLEELGALGRFGFVDALDFTRPSGPALALVRTFMAHHVGMTVVSLTNALQSGIWQRRFHGDPMIRAVALLLDERVPRRIAVAERHDIEPHESLPVVEGARPVVRVIETPETRQPHVAFLGQAPYTIMISHAGAGYARYEDIAVTRWRSDGTLDNTGQFCYVKDVTRGRTWSAAHQPVCAPADWYRALLATDRVTLHRADGDIDTRTEIVVVPADSAEVRLVTVTNNGDATRDVELTSYGEIVMAPPAGDRLHPAFSNLFVETEWHDWCTAVTAKRRPRSADERELWCVHVVDSGRDRVGNTTCRNEPRAIHRSRTHHARPRRARGTTARCRGLPAPCSTRSSHCARA
jgi:cyclic beta-1,2-glucan synthetase